VEGPLTPLARPVHPPGERAGRLEETVYYVDFQGVRFIALNSVEAVYDDAPDHARLQAAWLEGLLRDNPNRWTVVTFHHPVSPWPGGGTTRRSRSTGSPSSSATAWTWCSRGTTTPTAGGRTWATAPWPGRGGRDHVRGFGGRAQDVLRLR
jgi:hypothetical protein